MDGLPLFGSYATGKTRQPELFIRSNRRVKIAKQVDRSATESERGKGDGNAALVLVDTSSI